ncbi:MAG: PIG-L family deacetylase [Thermoflexales bacterium]|nr:PIG-L family deacetylase [Thermoflexales bacterium]
MSEFIPTSAMVIVAHPDDIEFGCAGTVAHWTRRGCRVVYVLATSGNGGTHDPAYTRESIAVLREQEQTAAAALCGVTEVEYLRHQDGEVIASLTLRKDFIRMIRKHKPQVVITMDPSQLYFGSDYINHPDHRAVGTAALDAIAPVAAMPLMYPELGEAHRVHEVWLVMHPTPDTWVDISDVLDTKLDALRQHKSQVGEDVVKMVAAWAREAGHGLIAAENFKVMKLVAREPAAEPAAQNAPEAPAA